ncbi:hypothetical protein CEXT_112881 [Caerostris extrusa]|uniref:Uncharacterized protein n=1 Tax=Caerostris extrusa TaxID=172846 RepID=A0AAV4QA93_CAEEX|nr:hypothetical protein CEXT_112881 [Caerostris extrusa]
MNRHRKFAGRKECLQLEVGKKVACRFRENGITRLCGALSEFQRVGAVSGYDHVKSFTVPPHPLSWGSKGLIS